MSVVIVIVIVTVKGHLSQIYGVANPRSEMETHGSSFARSERVVSARFATDPGRMTVLAEEQICRATRATDESSEKEGMETRSQAAHIAGKTHVGFYSQRYAVEDWLGHHARRY